ncbi:tetratricopeptide repeat protein [Spirosoma sp.]|uniref:tetratricopeptide repeat-containing sensor histidine kinase n=1 Tax=Spirosoma sp. TaxID=1899569 RepID=UPI003B3B1DD7
MNYLLIGILLFLNLTVVQAQNLKNPKLDSLDRLIRQASTDTGRINLTNKKISLLTQVNIDSAIRLSLQTIEKAKRINYKQGEVLTRVHLAYSYSFKGNYAAAKKTLKTAESIAISLKDSVHLLKVYNSYGSTYGMQSKYDSAITYFEKSMAIAEQINSKANLGSIYLNLGISYDMQSNRPQALFYQQKALTLAESQKDYNTQAYCLVNIANIYKLMGDLKAAEQRYKRAINLSKLEGIKNVELYAYTNLVDIYTLMNAPQKAYEFAMKAAALGKEIGDTGIQATSLSKAATNLANQKKFKEAEQLDKQAIAIADASNQPLNIHQTYAAMGSILNKQGNYAAAIPYFEKSFSVLKDADIYDSQTGESYAELSSCYEKTGNFRLALAAYKRAAAISDSVRGKENVRKSTELAMTYEFNKKQQAAQAEQQQQAAQAKNRQLALGAGMGLMLILAATSFYAYRTKQKANTLLQQQKEELQQALTKLQTTQTQLIQSEKMASLGELTAGIAHEIQNPLNFVNNFSEVSTELLTEIQQERKKAERNEDTEEEILGDLSGNLAKINHHGKRASNIVRSMLEHSRAHTGQKQLTDLNKLSDEYLRLAYHGIRAKDKELSINLVTHFDSKLAKAEVIPQEVGRVLLNLFNNAFYAVRQKQQTRLSDYQPAVTVSTRNQHGMVEIRVHDNGTGIPQPVLDKIFQPFFTTKPTGQGTGLGLSLSYDIITKGHGGTLTVNTQPGEFSEFIIHLPIK